MAIIAFRLDFNGIAPFEAVLMQEIYRNTLKWSTFAVQQKKTKL